MAIDKQTLDDLNNKIERLANTINDYSFKVDLAMKKAEELMNQQIKQGIEINQLLSIGNNVDKENMVRNQDVIDKINSAVKILTENKDIITKSIIKELNLESITEALSNYTTTISGEASDMKTFLTAEKSMIESLSAQVKILFENVNNIKKLTDSMGFNVDYNREVQDIIKFMKANTNRGIRIEELRFRFNPSIVKRVLEAGENLGYWTFRF